MPVVLATTQTSTTERAGDVTQVLQQVRPLQPAQEDCKLPFNLLCR